MRRADGMRLLAIFAIPGLVACGDAGGPQPAVDDAGLPSEAGGGDAAPVATGAFVLEKTVDLTSQSEIGKAAFCRLFSREDNGRLLFTFESADSDTFPANATIYYQELDDSLAATSAPTLMHTGTVRPDYAAALYKDDYYLLTPNWGTPDPNIPSSPKWRLAKYDSSYQLVKEVDIALADDEVDNDMMLGIANGLLDASSLKKVNGTDGGDPSKGAATFHKFFTTDLQAVNEMTLEDTPHVNGSSLLCEGDNCHFFSSSAFLGDIIVMNYGSDWSYQGSHTLIKDAQWPQGSAYANGRYYLAYLDMTNRNNPNAAFASFSESWELVQKQGLTTFGAGGENYEAGRPWVTLHKGKAYVVHDVVLSHGAKDETPKVLCRAYVLDL